MNGKTNVTVSGGNDSLGDIIPLNPPTAFVVKGDNAKCLLTWTDPLDKYATPEGEQAQDSQQLVSLWDHTVLVRKTGSQPTSPHDGTVVVSSSVRNQYQSTTYIDAGLINDTAYHYGIFAYNTDGVASKGAFASATPVAGTPLSDLAEGTLIKIQENSSPVEFYLAKHNYEEGLNGAGRELVVRKDGYAEVGWGYGNYNTYVNSALDGTLNGNQGYRTVLSDFVVEAAGKTKIYYTPGPCGAGSTTDRVRQRSFSFFALSLTELGISENANEEGSELPISAILRPLNQGYGQWTRSPYLYDNKAMWTLDTSGNARDEGGGGLPFYARPCFTLPSTLLVDAEFNLIENN